MKKNKPPRFSRVKILSLALSFVLILPFVSACGFDGEVEKYGRDVNEYFMDAAYDHKAHTLEASYKLSYINNAEVPLNELKLHLYPNAYREGAKYAPVRESQKSRAYPSGASYGDITVSNVTLNGKAADFSAGGDDTNILTVKFPTSLYPSARYTVEMKFKVRLAKILHRLGYNDKTVNLGNFYPIACVYEKGAFVTDPYYNNGDCFYSDISNYEVTLRAPSSLRAAFTGTEEAAAAEGGVTAHKIRARAVRGFACVLSERFETVSRRAGETLITYYYYDDAEPERALKTAADSLNTFNAAFGVYPYRTLSVVKTGFAHGGMEYSGLVYISDASEPDYFREVVAHEIAHQWWYGVVGNNEVKEPWLDEGLADYCTTVFFEKNPDYGVKKADRIAEALKGYLLYVDIYQNLTGQIDTSMNRPTNAYKDEYEYVYMTYVKGELLFDNLRSLLGDDAFFKGLRKYYDKYKFTNVSAPHLIGAFESASGKDLNGFFKAWLEGKVTIADIYS